MIDSSTTGGGSPALALEDVSKCFGSLRAVDGLSLTVRRGMVYGILGPNGAGKTTTLRVIMRILLPDRGVVLHHGMPASAASLRTLGYLPEERGLYPQMRVHEQLAFFAAIRGIAGRDIRHRVTQWLELLGLQECASRRTAELSKGMQQLLQLAAAMIHRPDFVVLDEPFSGLDPFHVARIMELITERSRQGDSFLLSTHAMEQAEEICDHVCLLNHGAVIADGSIDDVRRMSGPQILRVRFREPMAGPHDTAHDTSVRAPGALAEIVCSEADDPLRLLHDLTSRGEITGFELRPPRLRETFLRLVS